ncbi:hexosaminidase [Saccharothrix violaceirubra]|uniref:beta-N-acetylhexosaminidase n=1 Tax=Saccharothrix violaceirubra TaxID=413306 RepID=A0A7W7WYW1_9PSEU|nr:family 20 glycosylhydrolase [Saccharothrix violaceirubra]MBB4968148.1 hexosaminidase [Saccharothrix violaceirubra]
MVAGTIVWNAGSEGVGSAAAEPLKSIVPVPVSVQAVPDAAYTITMSTKIYVAPGARAVGDYLAGVLRPSTGFPLDVVENPTPPDGIILQNASAPGNDQGYELITSTTSVTIRASTNAGFMSGAQTLRQLLPAKVEYRWQTPGPWTVPGAKISDYPRFPYRGAMLDVARHFHPVATVKRYLDQLALYKINFFHLHLSDDQGWRIVVDSWPRLTTHGGSTQVGGGPGGFFTKDEYKDIVAYAAARQITVIPEIDLPGHTNAALSSYAELNCNGTAPPLRTDIEVGYSSLCISKDVTYKFVEDVIRELAEITPGPYLHIGGDEANATSDRDYQTFMDKVLPLVGKYGKKIFGWHEFVKTTKDTTVVPQYWGTTTSNAVVQAAAARGNKILMSPANKAYLDMKYNSSTPLGLSWAGMIEVQDAYNWNPGTHVSGVQESSVLGVEAPLWTETIVKPEHIDYMVFPRLPAIAELGWSPWSTHDWNAFKARLGAQGARWNFMGIQFYRSTQVPWDGGPTTTSPRPPTAWAAYTSYAAEDKVTYNGTTYKCLQQHMSLPGWEPPNARALWAPA